ncbi:hypothetical protein [Streptomyces sp. NPDC008092]|uniref:hypothetical protein n=1 Tax=Streptomyces sp. NPDC008092 TaxID=3364808 RepID=UPI0036EA9C76
MQRRYHPPTDITLPDDVPAQDGERLRAAVATAIHRALRTAAPGETTAPPTAPRPKPRERVTGTDRHTYAVPSYDHDGEKVGVPAAARSADPNDPHNTLTADEMFDLWRHHWTARLNRAIGRAEEIRKQLWHRDAKAYTDAMDAFAHGHRAALGPEYEAAVDERDQCAFILSATVRGWLLLQEQRHRPVTFEQVNAQAFRMAQAHATMQNVVAPVLIAGLGSAPAPAGRTAPPPTTTAPVRPAPPRGIAAWSRAWAVRSGLSRAMTGVDEALPVPRTAASSRAPSEQSPAPAPPPAPSRPSTVQVRQPVSPVRQSAPLDTTLSTEDVFAQIAGELAALPSSAAGGSGPAAAVADARAAGLIGPQGVPGTADLAVQRHTDASAVRGAYGVTGAQVQSAHASPTSFLRDVPGYSRGAAPSVLLPTWVHTAFDQHWKNWAMARRRAGDTTVTAAALYAEMLTAVDRIPLLDQATRNAIAWVIHRELFYDLGLAPGDRLTLPYPNVPPSP